MKRTSKKSINTLSNPLNKSRAWNLMMHSVTLTPRMQRAASPEPAPAQKWILRIKPSFSQLLVSNAPSRAFVSHQLLIMLTLHRASYLGCHAQAEVQDHWEMDWIPDCNLGFLLILADCLLLSKSPLEPATGLIPISFSNSLSKFSSCTTYRTAITNRVLRSLIRMTFRKICGTCCWTFVLVSKMTFQNMI